MLRRHLTLTVLGAVLGATVLAGPASAQGVDGDVRCLLLSNFFSKTEKEAPKKQMAAMTGLFYAGRVDARLSGNALKAQLIAQTKALQGQNSGQLMTACAQQVLANQRNLSAIGQQIGQAQVKK